MDISQYFLEFCPELLVMSINGLVELEVEPELLVQEMDVVQPLHHDDHQPLVVVSLAEVGGRDKLHPGPLRPHVVVAQQDDGLATAVDTPEYLIRDRFSNLTRKYLSSKLIENYFLPASERYECNI